jgi:hypothetical protein
MPLPKGLRTSILPVLAVLIIGGVGVYLKIQVRRAENREFQERLAESSKLVDEQLRKQAHPAGITDRERGLLQATTAAMFFLGDVRADRLTKAYGETTPAYRERVGQASFEELIRKYPAIKQADQCLEFVNISYADGSVRSVQLGKPADENGDTPVVNISVVKQDHWVVNDFTVRPRGK